MSAIAFLRELLDAGLDLEAALIAAEKHELKSVEAAEAKAARRRERDAARKRAERVRNGHAESRGVTRTERDSGGPSTRAPTCARVVVSSSSSLRSEEGKPPPTPNGVGAPKGAETMRGTRLPDGWEPGGDDWAKAMDLLGGDVPAVNELDRFRDYWRAVPGAKGRKSDWPATWRNWVRRASENLNRAPNGQRPHTDHRRDAFLDKLSDVDAAMGAAFQPVRGRA